MKLPARRAENGLGANKCLKDEEGRKGAKDAIDELSKARDNHGRLV